MLDTLPLMVNGIDSENCEPVFSDAELLYHAANVLLTSTLTVVFCNVAPAAGVKVNVAVFISSVVEVPTTVT